MSQQRGMDGPVWLAGKSKCSNYSSGCMVGVLWEDWNWNGTEAQGASGTCQGEGNTSLVQGAALVLTGEARLQFTHSSAVLRGRRYKTDRKGEGKLAEEATLQ